jgi:hypothetical protein
MVVFTDRNNETHAALLGNALAGAYRLGCTPARGRI